MEGGIDLSGDTTARVTAGDERSPARDTRLVQTLMVGLRTALLFEPENAAAQTAITDLMNECDERFRVAKTICVDSRNRTLFVDEERLRARASDYLTVRRLLALFDERGIGWVTFHAGLARDELTLFVYTVARDRTHDPERLARRLEAAGVKHVDVGLPVEEGMLAESGSALHTYSICLDVCQELHRAVQTHGQIRTRRLRRVAQAVVDQLLADESSLLALTTIKEFDDYLFNHSTNVAILSIALGQRLGLTKTQLGDLCLAAFLHDMGKIQIPREILEKKGPLDADEWDQIHDHPISAVYLLLQQQNLSQSTLRAIIGGFEHHLNHDLSGYPSVVLKTSLSLFGRIISVADRFDAITTARAYRTVNLTPYDGIAHLIAKSGTEFDPVLVKVFIETMGLYPPGTVVGLDSGQIGVVRRPPLPGTPVNRPEVYVIRGEGRHSCVDLAERGPDGRHLRGVRLVYNPGNAGQFPAVTLGDFAPEGPDQKSSKAS